MASLPVTKVNQKKAPDYEKVHSSFVAYYMTAQILIDWRIRVFQAHHTIAILKPLWKNKTILILATLQMH